VRGEKVLPITTSGIKGLPKVLRRGVVDTQDSGPSLLFLDLPDPPLSAGDPVPERFQSNVLLSWKRAASRFSCIWCQAAAGKLEP
jgi:hypothetical protein